MFSILVNQFFLIASRPVAVCLCPYFPEKPVAIDTNVYILQHPLEVIKGFLGLVLGIFKAEQSSLMALLTVSVKCS